METLVDTEAPETAAAEQAEPTPEPEKLGGEAAETADAGAAPDEQAAEPTPDASDEAKEPGTTSEADEAEADQEGKPDYSKLALGENSPLSEAHLDSVRALAEELGASTESAQFLVERDEALLRSFAAAQSEAFEAQSAAWLAEIEKDKDLGGKNLPQTRANYNRALSTFGDAEAVKGLAESGYANWPPLVRLLAKAGAAAAESESLLNGSGAANSNRTAQSLYPNSPDMHG